MKSKVFLSLKFFTIYIKKQTKRNERADEHHKRRQVAAGWSSLRLWVEDTQHRRAKMQVANEFCKVRVTQRWFIGLAVVVRERVDERQRRLKADQLFL